MELSVRCDKHNLPSLHSAFRRLSSVSSYGGSRALHAQHRASPAARHIPHATAAVLADAATASTASAAADGCSGIGCAQDLLDSVGSPFAALAESLPQTSLLPGLTVVLSIGGLLVWRFAVYGQREYIIAAMIRKYIPQGRAVRVLQVGGTTRDVFYYPEDTTSVTVVGSDIKAGLMEQAGVQAGIPVQGRKQSPTDLSFQGTGALDAVVAFNSFGAVGDVQAYLSEVARVLKPGAPFIFIDRVVGQGVAAVAQPLVGSAFQRIDEAELQQLRTAENLVNVSGDMALKGQDPHAVGVAFRAGGSKRDRSSGGDDASDSGTERRQQGRKRSKGGGKGFAAAAGKS